MSDIIKKSIHHSSGSDETTKLELLADTKTGESYFILRKEIRQRFKLTEYVKAEEMFEQITGGGGRPVIKISDFAPQ